MIEITKRAVEEIKLSARNPEVEGLIIRFAVEETEEGFRYLMGFDERKEDDIHLESNGLEYLLSYSQKKHLEGTTVDFDELNKDEGYHFIFNNPNDKNYKIKS
ncbi:IscA-like protein, DsrR [hydrothermal vent metagenome]|uniref:IscA-like protein, DsrR n=1 Tax=hydrothermal vent metagenome TaxID=652676 RepID=A0A1W1BLM3_9ZZZZ